MDLASEELGVATVKRIKVDEGMENSDLDTSNPPPSVLDDNSINSSRDFSEDGTLPDGDTESSTLGSSSDTNADPDDAGGDEKVLRIPKFVFYELMNLSPSMRLSRFLWLQEEMFNCGDDPLTLLAKINGHPRSSLTDIPVRDAWKLIISHLGLSPRRAKLPSPKTVEDVVELIQNCNKIFVLTGAGVSVSCGIPDFRSRNGIYARLAEEFPSLPDPQAMFDIDYFQSDPKPFFSFAKEIYPGQFKPSPCHRFIKLLERKNKLLRNYTQNIDTLERVAGIENLIECHGSFATATCTKCKHKVGSDEIKHAIFQQMIPYCTKCATDVTEEKEKGIMKPDIVFFGEDLPNEFHDSLTQDKEECDLLIVIGSSLKVRPVSIIPGLLPETVPQILINRERLGHTSFDVELLGDSDVIVDHLCSRLGEGWSEIRWMDGELKYIPKPSIAVPSSSAYDSTGNLAEDDFSGEVKPAAEVKCERIGMSESGEGRHMSFDSSRDSGIGEASNCSSDISQTVASEPKDSAPSVHDGSYSAENSGVFTFPDGCYFRVKPRVFAFPGAEL